MAWVSAFLVLSFASLTGLWFQAEMIISSNFTKNLEIRTQLISHPDSELSQHRDSSVLLLPPPRRAQSVLYWTEFTFFLGIILVCANSLQLCCLMGPVVDVSRADIGWFFIIIR